MGPLKSAILTLCLVMVCYQAIGQIMQQDTAKWNFGLSSTFSYSGGNVERLLLRSMVETKHVHNRWGFASTTSHIYGTFSGFQTENDLISKNFVYLFPKKKVYPYLMGWLETNYRRNLKFRHQVGPGVTYAILWKDKHLIKLSATGTFERSTYGSDSFTELGILGSKTINNWRATARIYGKHSFFKQHLNLGYEVWWQQSLTDIANYRYLAIINMEVPVFKGLAVKVNLDRYFESVVPVSAKPGDTYFTIGLTYKQTI